MIWWQTLLFSRSPINDGLSYSQWNSNKNLIVRVTFEVLQLPDLFVLASPFWWRLWPCHIILFDQNISRSHWMPGWPKMNIPYQNIALAALAPLISNPLTCMNCICHRCHMSMSLDFAKICKSRFLSLQLFCGKYFTFLISVHKSET